MSNRAVFIIVLLIATVIGYVGYTFLNTYYLTPRAKLVGYLDQMNVQIDQVRGERSQAADRQEKLQAYIDRTLGPDKETVEHELRSRLNRLAEEIGLTAQNVSTGDMSLRLSPAKNEFSNNKKKVEERKLYDEVDFAELNGFIAGDGTYAQAIELIAALKAEPWIKYLYFVHLDPRDGGKTFRVTVHLRTLFFPGKSPGKPMPEGMPALDQTKLATLAEKNPFALPAPPEPEQPVRVANNKPRPKAFPYDKWVMTGIVSGPTGGKEVWLLESGSGETKLLTPGEQLSDMKLVDADGDAAQFEYNGKSIQLFIGQNLGEGVGRNGE